MFVSKKRWKQMERRVAALEKQLKQDNAPHSKCSCKYAVRPDDKSVPRPPH